MTRKVKNPPPREGRGQGVGRTSSPEIPRDAQSIERRVSPRHLASSGHGESEAYNIRDWLIHEDAHILVFNKPSGLAVQGGSGVAQSLEHMLGAFAKSNGKRPRLVHRLDRDTSGVIVAARTKPAAAFLSQAFAERQVQKTYLAVVCGGAPEPQAGEIVLGLRKASRGGLDIMEIDERGQAALTRYKTLAATRDAALQELKPETGRMHQLRAHLAAIGRPIAGDGKYGGLFQLGAAAIPRLMLHAAALDLPHPEGGRRSFAAAPPADFAAAAALLGLEEALARISL